MFNYSMLQNVNSRRKTVNSGRIWGFESRFGKFQWLNADTDSNGAVIRTTIENWPGTGRVRPLLSCSSTGRTDVSRNI